MATDPVGPFPLDNVQMPAWLLRFDKDGECNSPATRQALLKHLRDDPAGRAHTDIVFFSHGWNNDFDDASQMYAKFLRNFEVLAQTYPPARAFDPLFVGVFWPSIWLSFDNGPDIASASAEGPSKAAQADAEVADALAAELVPKLAAAGASASLERVRELLAQARLNDGEARELATLLAPAFGSITDDETAGGARSTTPDELYDMLKAMQQATLAQGAPAAPPTDIDAWGEPPPPEEGEAQAPSADGLSGIKTAGWLDFVDPRNALRMFSVYRMKDRAGVVGAHGIAALLRDVLGATEATAPRVHAVGHSYGCKVMLSAVCSPAPLQRPLASLLLLQPAISHLCFADVLPNAAQPGGYRTALQPDRVTGPIYSTYSSQDFALHATFHLALLRDSDVGEKNIGIATAGPGDTTAGKPPSKFAALGGYGPRRAGQQLVDPMPMAGANYPPLATGTAIVGLDGSQDVIHGHGDITTSAAAWALNRLVFR